MTKEVNQEQFKAIHKKNGLILSAGAGSGKTFVIIEHLILKFCDIKKNFYVNNDEHFLGNEISKIVLMTFTKKAAGEMQVRLIKRINEVMQESGTEIIFWKAVLRNISRLNISTIHSFCHRLLALNSSLKTDIFPQKIDLRDDYFIKNKIENILESWASLGPFKNSTEVKVYFKNIVLAVHAVFQSPELRVNWEEDNDKIDFKNEVNNFFNELSQLKNYHQLFFPCEMMSFSAKDLEKQGYKIIYEFYNLVKMEGFPSAENYKKYFEFGHAIIRFPPAPKTLTKEEYFFREKMKEFFEDVKKIKDDFEALESSFAQYLSWHNLLKSAFVYVNSEYHKSEGFSFSDLEYYSYKLLQIDQFRAFASAKYQYFIVDEFQDTSQLQYEIIKSLIGHDFQKLFCVGDKKQAIYGFRGGELEVFNHCTLEMGEQSTFSLLNNYRSTTAVIDFNNNFFSKVLPLGKEYQGVDVHSVPMDFQVHPTGEIRGTVESYKVVGDETRNAEYYEALAMAHLIENDLKNPDLKSIVVLYRALRPSHFLLTELRNKNIGYQAQIKIKYDSDPILLLLKELVAYLINSSDFELRDNQILLVFIYLQLLEFKNITKNDVALALNNFKNEVELFGLRTSFWKFLLNLNISNSFYIKNHHLVDSLISISDQSPQSLYNMLIENEGSYSSEEHFGSRKKVFIMTAHASKGLEFDSVYLGGIHKNGRPGGLKGAIGKLPRSFRWRVGVGQKKLQKSLQYYLEGQLLSLKEFSESKRLFYVAATRAVKKISWIDLEINGKGYSYYKNSWINPLREFTPEGVQNFELNLTFEAPEMTTPGFLLNNNLGIRQNLPTMFGILPELSVTRLADLVLCPFKFYIKHICKIDIDEKSNFFDQELTEGEVKDFYSSKERGVALHFEISRAIHKKCSSNNPEVQWVLDIFNPDLYDEIISEKEIKFSFMGQMISSVPDLILIDKQSLVIWDFKTGLRALEKEEGHWFQVYSYAFGYFSTHPNKILDLKEIELSLLYLDVKEKVTKKVSFLDIQNYLYGEWLKLKDLTQFNLKHCCHCDCRSICSKHSKSCN